MGARLLAIVAEGDRGRVYLAPTANTEAVGQQRDARVGCQTATMPADARAFTVTPLRNGHVERPLHPTATGCADDLYRSSQRSAPARFSDATRSWAAPDGP